MIALLECILLTGMVICIIAIGVYSFLVVKKEIQVLFNIREIKRNILEDIEEEKLKRRLNSPPPYTFKDGHYPVWLRR